LCVFPKPLGPRAALGSAPLLPHGVIPPRFIIEIWPREIDELATWKQHSDALAECDARGWEAIRSATAKLSECFPELWRTARAMEGWLRKNPLDPSLSIKRVWCSCGLQAQATAVLVTGTGAAWDGCAGGDSRWCWGCPLSTLR
jgi:hypothetical protein